MPIEQLDVVPSRYRPTTFTPDMENFLAWVARNVPNYNALEQSLQLVATTGTSATSLVIGTGSKTLTTQAGKAWVIGSFVYVVSAASVADLMFGQITAYNSSTGQLTINVLTSAGSATLTSWVIGLSVPMGDTATFSSLTSGSYYIDSTFYLTLTGGNPLIALDSTDYIYFDRAINLLNFMIGGSSQFYVSSTDGPARSNDATTNNGLVRKSQLDGATAQATTADLGRVKLASSSDVSAGTSSLLAVTPAALAAGKIVQSSAVNTTSGVAVDFTSIPSWAKRITIMFRNVSTNGSSMLLLQPGSGSPQTTGYTDSVTGITYGTSGGAVSSSSGIPIFMNSASNSITGAVQLLSMGSNVWIASGVLGSVASPITGVTVSGSIALSGQLDRVRLKTENGTDTFDNGSVCILWE